jgi:hypothetical protein
MIGTKANTGGGHSVWLTGETWLGSGAASACTRRAERVEENRSLGPGESMFQEEGSVKDLKNSPTGCRAKHRPDPSHLTFIIWAIVVSVAMILLSIALGVGIDPDVSIFLSP